MARAIVGDYVIPIGLRYLDQKEMENYTFIDNINDFELFKLDKSEDRNYQYDYILGYFENNIFKKIAKIYFNKIDEFYEVDTIYVSPDMRKDGIASELYTYFVKEHNYQILGACSQRVGARRLWSKLSKCEDLRVHIIDFENNKILEKDVQIYHGLEDSDFDTRVWCSGVSKKHIRLILRNK
jgi:GNAT superfamily N-acetyltransferase